LAVLYCRTSAFCWFMILELLQAGQCTSRRPFKLLPALPTVFLRGWLSAHPAFDPASLQSSIC